MNAIVARYSTSSSCLILQNGDWFTIRPVRRLCTLCLNTLSMDEYLQMVPVLTALGDSHASVADRLQSYRFEHPVFMRQWFLWREDVLRLLGDDLGGKVVKEAGKQGLGLFEAIAPVSNLRQICIPAMYVTFVTVLIRRYWNEAEFHSTMVPSYRCYFGDDVEAVIISHGFH